MRRRIIVTLFAGAVLLTFSVISPAPSRAGVNMKIGISVPPAYVSSEPPPVIVVPGTYTYYVPNIDIVFYHGY